MTRYIMFFALVLATTVSSAQSFGVKMDTSEKTEILVKLTEEASQALQTATAQELKLVSMRSTKFESLGIGNWYKVTLPAKKQGLREIEMLGMSEAVETIQPNFKLGLLHDWRIQDPLRRAALIRAMNRKNSVFAPSKPKIDNPAIPDVPGASHGTDPLFNKQWGMLDNNVTQAWKVSKGSPEMVVAVIDTGVDYTHEDLLPNLWRNQGELGLDSNGKEKSTNGLDDDNNGYVDDVIGWDFVANDNKPYDLSSTPLEIISKGGNPGHGTHCAGNVAARGENGKGVAGVAPLVKIMSLRFISEKAGGTTADAIKAIKYAVDNGAKVLSNSWGGEGDRNDNSDENKALIDAVKYSMDKGTLFIVAAGNGRAGKGFSNDTDPKPVYPASYEVDNIITVAAIDERNELGVFSNFGAKSVHIGAPGVKVFSTTVESNYSDTVIDLLGITATWDGTSMATPHVAGAAALYWSANPSKTWRDVRAAILGTAKKIPALQNKVSTNGKLDVDALMKY
jgi:thermitase